MLACMTDSTVDLPDDIERLKALVLAERAEKMQFASERDAAIAERDRLAAQNDGSRTCCASFGAITSGANRNG